MLYNEITLGALMDEDTSPKIPFRKRLSANMVNIILAVIFVYLLFLIGNLIWRNYQTNNKTTQLNDDIELVEIDNDLRRELLTYYQSDSYREVELRRRLILKQAGEKVVLLPIHQEESYRLPQNISLQNIPSEPVTLPNYRRWWQAFFGPKSPFK